jgi:hypothetical protein
VVVALVVGRLLVAVVVRLGLVALVGRLALVELVEPLVATLVLGRLVVGPLALVPRLALVARLVGPLLVAALVVVRLEPAALVVAPLVGLAELVAALVVVAVVALVALVVVRVALVAAGTRGRAGAVARDWKSLANSTKRPQPLGKKRSCQPSEGWQLWPALSLCSGRSPDRARCATNHLTGSVTVRSVAAASRSGNTCTPSPGASGTVMVESALSVKSGAAMSR